MCEGWQNDTWWYMHEWIVGNLQKEFCCLIVFSVGLSVHNSLKKNKEKKSHLYVFYNVFCDCKLISIYTNQLAIKTSYILARDWIKQTWVLNEKVALLSFITPHMSLQNRLFFLFPVKRTNRYFTLRIEKTHGSIS